MNIAAMAKRAFLAAAILALGAPALAQPLNQRSTSRPQIVDGATVTYSGAIDAVWSAHGVGFDILTTSTRVYVAYYDANRQLTLAMRPKGSKANWIYQKLDTWLGWDSHNYAALAVDGEGRIHLAANMHVDPLTYFQTDKGGDVRTARRITTMVDRKLEGRVTYPIFLTDGAGRLILKYRYGTSGDGKEIYNVYDAKADRWAPLLGAPLTDGEGRMNAYFVGPVLGPDKAFHIAWVWRDSPDASTNHDLSYARSRDLVHWTRSDGAPVVLPITLGKAEIVDAVPIRGGMINNNTVIGFDAEGRAMITYHKYDEAGDTQIFVARREASGWRSVQVSRWKGFRWDFSGSGTLNSLIQPTGARAEADGKLHVRVTREGKTSDFILEPQTLALIEERPVVALKDQLISQTTVPAGMTLNVIEAAGDPRFAIAWTANPSNRDTPTADIPPPTTLRLIEVKRD